MKTNWLEKQIAVSSYLSKRENWSPVMLYIAREYLIVGVITGVIMGICLCMGVFILMI